MSHPEVPGTGRSDAAGSNGARATRDSAIRGPARPGPYIAAGILLAVAILLPLMPQTYSFDAPRLGGMPFFYWYQLLWVPISAVLTGTAYWLVTKEDRRRRAEALAGSTAGPGTGHGDAEWEGGRP